MILPFTVLRRLDCVLASTKSAVLAELKANSELGLNPEPLVLRAAEQGFYNTDPLDLGKLVGDQDNIRANFLRYVGGFSPAVRDIFGQFDFHTRIERLGKAGLLYQITETFARVDLQPAKVDNTAMGLAFEGLIRKFAEISCETAGEHVIPREVIRLMVNLLFVEGDTALPSRAWSAPFTIQRLEPAVCCLSLESTSQSIRKVDYPSTTSLALSASARATSKATQRFRSSATAVVRRVILTPEAKPFI
ncbi:type I restriction-modification system DNA methylase subunit [Methylobacterium sp. RAS18]|nr:type I restriction-modification system DNA methylase subunit [Methylobacterium sp. RAS18]